MKLLYICGDTNLVGGIEKYNREFISILEKQNVNCKVVYRHEGGVYKKIKFSISVLISFISFRPDYLINGHVNFGLLALIGKYLFSVPYSTLMYGIDALNVNRPLFSKTVFESDRLVVCSTYVQSLLDKFHKFPNEKFFLLKSSVDPSEYLFYNRNELKAKYGLSDKRVILTLSRLTDDEDKGQDRALLAFKSLCKRKDDCVMVLAGPGTDQRVESAINSLDFPRDKLIRFGGVDFSQKVELLNLCDVFLLPTRLDGFLIVYIEAMICGAEIVAPDGYGCRDGLKDGELGHLIDPLNIEQISDVLQTILSKKFDQSRREQLRSSAIELYGSQTWSNSIMNFIEYING